MAVAVAAVARQERVVAAAADHRLGGAADEAGEAHAGVVVEAVHVAEVDAEVGIVERGAGTVAAGDQAIGGDDLAQVLQRLARLVGPRQLLGAGQHLAGGSPEIDEGGGQRPHRLGERGGVAGHGAAILAAERGAQAAAHLFA